MQWHRTAPRHGRTGLPPRQPRWLGMLRGRDGLSRVHVPAYGPRGRDAARYAAGSSLRRRPRCRLRCSSAMQDVGNASVVNHLSSGALRAVIAVRELTAESF